MLGYSLEVVSSAWNTLLDPVLLSGGGGLLVATSHWHDREAGHF